MLWNPLIKNPILAIGILMISILLFDLSRRGILPLVSNKIIATSCKSVLVMLKKRTPRTWELKCKNNNMTVTIRSLLDSKTHPLPDALYRELANNLQFIARNGLHESLERTLVIRVHVVHPQMEINAITEGKDLAKLANLTKAEFITEHLKATVQVQDTFSTKKK